MDNSYPKYKIDKREVRSLLRSSLANWDVYAPLKGVGGDVQFVRLDKEESLDRLDLGSESPLIPPKTVVFPQIESLFAFKGGEVEETLPSSGRKFLFGMRACDLKGMLFMDAFFKRNFEDIYYLGRAANRLVVVVGCKRPPREGCFCTSAKTGPFLEKGFDLQMVDLEEVYLVEVGSERGEEFIRSHRRFFQDPLPEDIECSERIKREAEEAVRLKVDFEEAIRRFCADEVPQEIYERIAERCIYCGGCLYVCPTCTCFNVFDDRKGNSGVRYRNWDACVFEGYTREASGHNPRAEKWIRTSRRYEHKLKYDYLATGTSGCVGCGRCLEACPVNIGIAQVIEAVAEGEKK